MTEIYNYSITFHVLTGTKGGNSEKVDSKSSLQQITSQEDPSQEMVLLMVEIQALFKV